MGLEALDWAANEEQQLPTYEEAIRRVPLESGREYSRWAVDPGVFLRRRCRSRRPRLRPRRVRVAARDRARRVPEADLRVGDMQFLPYDDDAFDAVAGFNSFFFAADIVAALREAGRVAARSADRDPGLGAT